MDDLGRILAASENLIAGKKRAALATLAHVTGASFRKVGSRLLVDEDGNTVGGVSAGCLEDDVVKKAMSVASTGKSLVACYDTGSEREILFGWGTGCSGLMTILIEPLSFADGQPAFTRFLQERRRDRFPAPVATVIEAPADCGLAIGEHFYADDWGGEAERPECGTDVVRQVRQDLLILSPGACVIRDYTPVTGAPARILLESVLPPPALMLFGAGPAAVPLALFAQETGWNVSVHDRRPGILAGNAFADGTAVCCASYDGLGDRYGFDAHSAAVVMTHSFLDDVQIIKQLLQSPVRIVSVLSSRGRADKLFAELRREAPTLTEDQLARVHAPAGLEIGANSPSQIALSIMAEIQKEFMGGSGRALMSLHAHGEYAA